MNQSIESEIIRNQESRSSSSNHFTANDWLMIDSFPRSIDWLIGDWLIGWLIGDWLIDDWRLMIDWWLIDWFILSFIHSRMKLIRAINDSFPRSIHSRNLRAISTSPLLIIRPLDSIDSLTRSAQASFNGQKTKTITVIILCDKPQYVLAIYRSWY